MTKQRNPTASEWSRFLVPTAIGIALFLIPVPFRGAYNIGLGIVSDLTIDALRSQLPLAVTVVICASALLSLATSLAPRLMADSLVWRRLFSITSGWLVWRIVGGILAALVYLQVGPEWITSATTGGNMMTVLLPIIFVLLFLAMLLLPLLTDFGLMELIGTLVQRFFRRVFSLPGRSSIDAVASWMGSGTVGVAITAGQFDSGFYTEREAAVISTNFSIVSIAFCVVIAQTAGVSEHFVLYYTTVVIAALLAAVITPRIPPLSWKEDRYYARAGKQIVERVPAGRSAWQWGLEQALERARKAESGGVLLKRGLINGLDIWFGLQPLVMAFGTISLIVVEYTDLFVYVAFPFAILLQALSIPEATAAAPAVLVGFADQFLPALLAQNIDSVLTRFVIAGMSVTQLIYMSEVGVLILRSRIPLSLWELFVIFLIRTFITLPVFALVGHLMLGS